MVKILAVGTFAARDSEVLAIDNVGRMPTMLTGPAPDSVMARCCRHGRHEARDGEVLASPENIDWLGGVPTA
jgi:hypothetical protein